MTSPLVDPRRPWLAERARLDPGALALIAGAERPTFGELPRTTSGKIQRHRLRR